MRFTEYQTNNMKSLITYLEDCMKYDQEKEDYRKLYGTIESLRELLK